PKISIIMPTWNRAAYIMESVESVLSQTYQNWELIIIDDGSEDNTEELISKVNDSRIRFHKRGKTGIGIRLKYVGIEMSDGELIAFLDSDDLWAPTKLERQVAIFQEYPEAGFSLTGGYNFQEQGKPLEYFYKQNEGVRYGKIFISFFTSEAALMVPSLMFKRECVPVILQSTINSPNSDVDFLLSLALHYNAVILYEPLLFRRIHDSGYSKINWEKGYLEWVEVIKRYKKKLPPAIAKDALFRLYINYGEKCLLYNKRLQAAGNFLRAWTSKPLSIVPLKKVAKAILRKAE
ncbi:MAG TPA: glycosyltransferase, partial [Ferruginibacter sp.]|nr:glycosyltransferase [Ferruginibacter sp.]